MRARISVNELSRGLTDVLDRIRRGGETFVVQEDGTPVAALGPANATDHTTWSILARRLRDASSQDPMFASDLEDVQRGQPAASADAWPS